jgi:TonB-linked SusC/RagA family outer membrane protein
MNKLLLLLVFTMGMVLQVSAQIKTVTGVVKGSDENTLAQTTVTIKATKKSVVCDNSGRYRIEVSGENAVLVFSQVGYATKEMPVAGKTVIDVVLTVDASTLGDVVVVGYGTQRKKDVTVSIEKVNMADLNKAPVRSFDEALAGRVAGVQVTSSDGQPGAFSNIVIRGNNSITQDNSPLYIIDGFPVENPNNNALNPADIESIEILKDASATAIYGSRGANGVVMITTKKGKEGPPVISFGTSYAFQEVINKIELMSPYEFVKFQTERDTTTIPGSPTDRYLTSQSKTLESYRNVKGTDWQSLILRRAPMLNHTISITGGSTNTKYAISGSILNQDGIVINSNYTRYQGRIVLDQIINRKLKVGINANYSYLKQSGEVPSQSQNEATNNVMFSIWGQRPVLPNTDDDLVDDLFDPAIDVNNDYRINPVIHLNNVVRNSISKNLLVNSYAEYSILPDLKFKVTGGISSNIIRGEVFNNTKTRFGNPITSFNGVNGSISYTEVNTLLNENILSWNKKFNKNNNLNLVGVFAVQKGKSESFGSSATFLPNEQLGLSSLDEGVPQVIASTSSDWALSSFAFRGAYNFKSKYFLTGSYRADGSSRFAPGNRWGFFPSLSFAWRLSNEDFIKKLKIFSDAKLRIGYGSNGNNRVSDFAYLSTIGLPIGSSYTINNSIIRGSVPTAIGNPELKWETTTETNIALDLSILKNRISLTTEVYSKRTNDLLLRANLPLSSGYSTAFKNIGSVQNKGLEFTLNTNNFTSKTFTWSTSFNIAFNRNKVVALNEAQESITTPIRWENNYQNTPAYIAKLGQPLGLMYGYIWEGVYQYSDFYQNTSGAYVLRDNVTTNGNVRSSIRPGDIKYRDINGDGVMNANDYTIIGNGLPKHTGGFSNNFTYKGFDLNIFFQWAYGHNIQNANRLIFDGNALNSAYLNQYATYTDRWSPDNQTSRKHRAGGYFGGGYSTQTIEDGSYLRLKTAALGYNLPESMLRRIKIKTCRVYVSAQNLITWTNYSGMDPEVNTYNSALTPGFDYSAYPRAKTITFGLNLVF